MTCPDCKGTGVCDLAGADRTLCDFCDGTGEIETCCICGRMAIGYYQGEDSPTCGAMPCELRMQAAMDYHDEAGDR